MADVVVVRFPDGTREFRFPEKMLEPGDLVRHDGRDYRVVHVNDEGGRPVVTVELDSDSLGDMLDSEQGAVILEPLDEADRPQALAG